MKLLVNPHKIEIEKSPVNEREIDITKCEFEFVEEIMSDYVKEAYFTFDGTSYKQIIVNNECDIPSEVLAKKGQIEIGVVAFLIQNGEEIKRYNPSPAYFNTWVGSLKDKTENTKPITPSEMEQYEQALEQGLNELDNALDDLQDKIDSGYFKGEKGDTGETGKSGSDGVSPTVSISKVDKTTTIEITDKDGKHISTINDGNDGFSPVANVTQQNEITTIYITDKNGTTTATINLNNFATRNYVDVSIESAITDALGGEY